MYCAIVEVLPKLYSVVGGHGLSRRSTSLFITFGVSFFRCQHQGMIYLHDSVIVSHGNLTSRTCLVDSRWVLQITDFGLHEFKAGQEMPAHVEQRKQKGDYFRVNLLRGIYCSYSELLWRAPELLRMMNPPARGTQKGDVYSFAIILYEIIGRKGPWGQTLLPPKCTIERVMNPNNGHVFRPPTTDLNCPDYVLRCMEDCWHEDPDVRPDFRYINIRLREMQSGLYVYELRA